MILSLITLSLGTLSYYGSLFVAPFLMMALIIYRLNFLKAFKKQLIISMLIVFSATSLILAYMLFKPGENTRSLERSGEVIIFNTQKITDNVTYDRTYSLSPKVLNELFVNKLTYLWRVFFFNYLEAFSPRMIFVEGDPNVNYGLWSRGEMSILDFPLVILGAFYLYRVSRKGLILVSVLIIISPITSGLTGTVYATRAFLMWPNLMILAGGGLAAFYEWSNSVGKRINWKKVAFFVFIALYLYFFFSRLHQYYFRYPVYAKEAWFDSEKQLTFYLSEHQDERITVYSLEGRQMFMEYFFFTKMDPKIAQAALSKDNIRADIVVGNLRFVNGCLNPGQDLIDHKIVVHSRCVPLNLELAKETIRTRDGSNRIIWAIFIPK